MIPLKGVEQILVVVIDTACSGAADIEPPVCCTPRIHGLFSKERSDDGLKVRIGGEPRRPKGPRFKGMR